MRFVVETDFGIFEASGISCQKRNSNRGDYILCGVDKELFSKAIEFFNSKKYTDISISEGNSVIIDGEDCWFEIPDPSKKDLILHINWVNKQLI